MYRIIDFPPGFEFNFLNVRDNFGQTGFYHACIKGCKNIVELILNKSKYVSFDLRDPNGCLQFANWVQILINNFELYRDWYGNMFNQGFDRPDIFQLLVLLFWTPWCYQAYSFLQNQHRAVVNGEAFLQNS